jgi:ATP-dependent Lon protease
MAEDHRILVVTQRRAEDDHPTPSALYGVGITASVIGLVNHGDGTLRVLAQCLKRAAIVQWAEGSFLAATIAPIEETREKEEEAVALSRTVFDKIRRVEKIERGLKLFKFRSPEGYDLFISPSEEPGVLADAVAARLLATIEKKQEILEAADVVTRLQKVLALMQTDEQAA